MNMRLKKLLEERDAAHAAFTAYVQPIIDAKRALTDDEEKRKKELRADIDLLDERIAEVNEEARTEEQLAEARKRAGLTTDMSVGKEPRVYDIGSPNSYIADLVRSSSMAFSGHHEAVKRMNQWSYEVSVEVARNTKEGQRARDMIREAHRTENGIDARKALEVVEARGQAGSQVGLETRAGMDTSAGSGGSFATPVYMVTKYAPYREAGRAFMDQCNDQTLPDYGMTVYIPHVTGPANVGPQAGQNQGVTETDPTAGYLSNALTTEFGQVVVSQQLLDRAGPNFSFDMLVFDQLERDYNPKVNLYVLATALANAGTITFNGTFAVSGTSGAGGLYSKVGAGKLAVRKGAGVFMNPTHMFADPSRWELCSAWADANGRPIVVPDYAGPFNAIAAGNNDGDTNYEGATGYRFNGLPVFQDAGIPVPSSGADQVIVGALDEVYVFEGKPVMRVIPQTYAANLSVLLQLYSYITCIPRYPTAIQAISGSAMGTVSL